MPEAARAPRVVTVSELTQRLRLALDGIFPRPLWVAGEISNWKRAASGHCYFTLKDEDAQLRCAMFQRAARTLVFTPADGMEVVVGAAVDVYPARGDLQLIVETMEPRGLGALRLAFEQLKSRLQAEGLFAADRKRPLPVCPRAIGIVTAATGAVIHDMRTTLARRWPAARLVLRPVRVQGEGAAAEIATAIGELCTLDAIEVLIVGRGGGSLEDLWAFNEEVVARAIATARVPVVSAVGHEVDFTIADFVADARAATPTAAAAMVCPDREEMALRVERLAAAARAGLVRHTSQARERLGRLERGLGDPRRRVRDLARRLDDLTARARGALARRVADERRGLAQLGARLERSGPAARVARERLAVGRLGERLATAVSARVARVRETLATRSATLVALSPLACLERGYAIVWYGEAGGAVVRDAAALAVGDPLAIRFARGAADVRVERRRGEDER